MTNATRFFERTTSVSVTVTSQKSGMYFDEFEIGQSWTSPSRTITEADLVAFAGISGDYNPLHTDEEYARTTQFGGRLFHGPGVLAVATGGATHEQLAAHKPDLLVKDLTEAKVKDALFR